MERMFVAILAFAIVVGDRQEADRQRIVSGTVTVEFGYVQCPTKSIRTTPILHTNYSTLSNNCTTTTTSKYKKKISVYCKYPELSSS